MDEHVAIKMLRDDVQIDDEHVARFLREAKATMRLRSEHVARIRDVGTLDDGKPYMAMELLEGHDLGRLLLDGPLPAAIAVDFILQACDALAEAHAIKIVHRDIKPTNLFVTRRNDGTALIKVLDFGISKIASIELSLTQTSSMLGTPAYMSPEQMRSAREADPRSDIWSLGTVLYELVEGRPPFAAASFAELCVMVTTESPRAMANAPQLAMVVGRCLAKRPGERFGSIAELARALAPFASEPVRALHDVARLERMAIHRAHSAGAPAASAAPTVAVRARRSRTPLAVGLLVVALFMAGIAAGLLFDGDVLAVPAAPQPELVPPETSPHVVDPTGAPEPAPPPPPSDAIKRPILPPHRMHAPPHPKPCNPFANPRGC